MSPESEAAFAYGKLWAMAYARFPHYANELAIIDTPAALLYFLIEHSDKRAQAQLETITLGTPVQDAVNRVALALYPDRG